MKLKIGTLYCHYQLNALSTELHVSGIETEAENSSKKVLRAYLHKFPNSTKNTKRYHAHRFLHVSKLSLVMKAYNHSQKVVRMDALSLFDQNIIFFIIPQPSERGRQYFGQSSPNPFHQPGSH